MFMQKRIVERQQVRHGQIEHEFYGPPRWVAEQISDLLKSKPYAGYGTREVVDQVDGLGNRLVVYRRSASCE